MRKNPAKASLTNNLNSVMFTECPAGYESKDGDIPGAGQIQTGIRTTMKRCSEKCNEDKSCCSYEYSYSSGVCNLNRDCQPTHTGEKYQNYNFCAKDPVNGGWGAWGSWCCDYNTGKKSRSRACNNPAPLYGGGACIGRNQEESSCKGKIFIMYTMVQWLISKA